MTNEALAMVAEYSLEMLRTAVREYIHERDGVTTRQVVEALGIQVPTGASLNSERMLAHHLLSNLAMRGEIVQAKDDRDRNVWSAS